MSLSRVPRLRHPPAPWVDSCMAGVDRLVRRGSHSWPAARHTRPLSSCTAFASYRAEPLPCSDFFIARGRGLAAFHQGAFHQGDRNELVAFGMHLSFEARGEWQIGVFRARKRIHLRTKGDGWFMLLAQPSNYSTTFAGIAIWNAEAHELPDNGLCRALLRDTIFNHLLAYVTEINCAHEQRR